MQNVLIIVDWCLCDFLLLKHINEVDGLNVHLSLTDVDIFFVWKIFYDFNTAFDYLLMLTYFSCVKCSYHCRLMFMWFSVIETYQRSGWTSSSFVIDIFFVWKIFYNFNTAFDYLLMLTHFSCAKCSYHSRLMFMWFSCPETYQYSAHTSSSFCHLLLLTYFCVENVPQFQYCFWLFTDIDYLSCAKCSYHVLIIFQNFNVAFDYLLMLTIFHVPKFL